MRGSLTKKHGSYYVRVDMGLVDGKRKQKWINLHTDNKKIADKAYSDTMKKIHDGAYVEDSKLTLESLLDTFLAHTIHEVKSSTYKTYEWAAKKYLIPALGDQQLTKLTAIKIESYLDGMKNLSIQRAIEVSQSPPDKKVPKPLSMTSIRYLYNVLKEALSYAVQKKLIPTNPCMAINPPKKQKFKPNTYNESQINLLISEAAKTDIYIPILLACTCGPRIGEVCGLRWDDVLMAEQLFQFRHSLDWATKDEIANPINRVIEYYEGPNGGILALTPVKTDNSDRVVAFPFILKDILDKEKNRQQELINLDDGTFTNNSFVWPYENGFPHSPDYLYKNYKDLIKKLELPDIRFHDLRHSHATILRDRGISMETISERLGHHSSAFTHRTYAHATKHTQAPAANIMDDMLSLSKTNE